ncbi:small toxic membrane polypeptide HokE, partial [Escherichia coli]|nr:small toxic membrane polypeptide HokE [Escherichia coli]
MPEAFRFQVNSEVWKDEAPGDISINPGAATPNLNNSDGSPFFAWRQY